MKQNLFLTQERVAVIFPKMFFEIPKLIQQLSSYAPFGNYATNLFTQTLNNRSVNDKKVTDHHALIITENIPNSISADQRIVYDMIVSRMLEAFLGKCTKENTTISMDVAGVLFTTKGSIFETLFSREYITRQKKSLVPTSKGLVVYLAIRDKKIADVSMTGEWENALNKIAAGKIDAETFHRGIEVYASQITAELLESKIEGGNHRESCNCPKCKSGHVTLYPKVAKCNNESCGLIVFRTIAKKELTDGQIKDLLTKGKTGVIKGFKNKENKPFDATLAFDADYKIVFSFPPKTGTTKKRR